MREPSGGNENFTEVHSGECIIRFRFGMPRHKCREIPGVVYKLSINRIIVQKG
jgi:hypothetical protein